MIKTPLETAIADYDRNFTSKWNGIMSDFRLNTSDNRVWIAGPSAYFLHLSGTSFAVDPQVRRIGDFDKIRSTLKEDTKDWSFVLITHQHDDHMCLHLMNELKDTPIRWYIPKGCPDHLIKESGLKEENIIFTSEGDVFTEGSLTIKAFSSPHVRPEDKGEIFVECGYEVISSDATLLFPGDIRDYDYNKYPELKKPDFCFSHVWAGDDALTKEKFLPMLEKFAEFNARFGAKKYFLGHLYEIGRNEKVMWNYTHAGIAMDMLYYFAPDAIAEVARMGHSYSLNPKEI